MARSSAQPQGRSPVVTLAIVGVVIIGVMAWRYMPGSMRSGTFLKVASQVLADRGGESDPELESRLRDLAIRSGLSMGDGAVEIRRPRDGVVEARLRYHFPVDLFVYRTRSEIDEVVTAVIRATGGMREATMKTPAPASQPAAETKKPPTTNQD